MTDVVYGITEEKYALGGTIRISYGIAAYAHTETNGTSTITAAVHDITDDKEKLESFVQTCNRLALSADHLHDAVEDFLAK